MTEILPIWRNMHCMQECRIIFKRGAVSQNMEGGGGDKNMKESQNLTPIDIFLCMNVPYTYRDILVLPF